MKKNYLLIFICTLSIFSQAQVTHLLDSTVTQAWITSSSSWRNSSREVHFKKATCQDYDSVYRYSWATSTTAWQPTYSYHYSYNPDGTMNVYDAYIYSTGRTPYYKYLYSYNSGLMSEYILQYWKTYLNALRNDTRLVYHRNPTTLLADTVFVQKWDTVTFSWKQFSKTINLYDINNVKIGNLYQDYPSNTYRNKSKAEYYKKANGKSDYDIYYNWDTITSTWINYSRYEYGYDLTGFLTSQIVKRWNPASLLWDNTYKYDYTNNSNGESIAEIDYSWESATSSWKSYSKTDLWYGCEKPATIEEVKTNYLTLYPNPTEQDLHVSFQEEYNQPNQLIIIDITGREVYSESVVSGIKQINVSQLPAGSYFLKLIGNKGIITRPFIKQ